MNPRHSIWEDEKETLVFIIALAAAVCLSWGCASTQPAHWPQWRGPNGNGVAEALNLPVSWSDEKNVVWKTELPSWSGSSPIVWSDRIFVMTPSKKEKPDSQTSRGGRGGRSGRGGRPGSKVSDPGGDDLLLFCISRTDGSVLWQNKLDSGNGLNVKHNATSPSPVTDGNHVWATTGNGIVVAHDMGGNEIWWTDLQEDYGNFGMAFGYASSPLLHDGKLIFAVLHGHATDDPSYLVALDGLTGKEVWKVDRPTDAKSESPDAYTTPALLRHKGKQQIVVSGGDYVTGHDPKTGEELWRSSGINPKRSGSYRVVPSPVVIDGMVYAPTRKKPLIALRAGGKGDITESHLAWKWDREAAPDVPTPACDGKYFYMADDKGMATCLDAKTGVAIWGPEDTGLGDVSASSVLADEKLYIVGESGETAVLQAGSEFKLLSKNGLDGQYTLSTPAIDGNQLYIRTAKHLYCIAEE